MKTAVAESFNDSLFALNQTAILFGSRFTLLKRSVLLLDEKKDFYYRQTLLAVEYWYDFIATIIFIIFWDFLMFCQICQMCDYYL